MWIKICGLSTEEDARGVAQLAPDAIGLNFYAKSPRSVSVEVAARIVRQLPVSVRPVGVFVNHSPEEIREICSETGIRTVQLHGDEPPETVEALPEFDVIRAVRVSESGLGEVAALLDDLADRDVRLFACLVDARVEGHYGGTGKLAPWSILADGWKTEWPPLILAGGITPANVADGIRTVRPFGVDTASGVEERPGKKSLPAVRAFIEQSRTAER